jgi:hypothetical protein
MWWVVPGMGGLFRNFGGESRKGHGLSTFPAVSATLFIGFPQYAIDFIRFHDAKTVAIQ